MLHGAGEVGGGGGGGGEAVVTAWKKEFLR